MRYVSGTVLVWYSIPVPVGLLLLANLSQLYDILYIFKKQKVHLQQEDFRLQEEDFWFQLFFLNNWKNAFQKIKNNKKLPCKATFCCFWFFETRFFNCSKKITGIKNPLLAIESLPVANAPFVFWIYTVYHTVETGWPTTTILPVLVYYTILVLYR